MQASTAIRYKINKPILTYFIVSSLLGITVWPALLYMGSGIQWPEVAIFFFMMVFGYIGINFGYHRGFSHRSYKMHPAIRWLILFSGASTGEGSALFWCSDHRRHHAYQDKEQDPYGIQKGFWWAHMGWMIQQRPMNFGNCKDLSKHRSVRWQHRFYFPIFLIASFGLPFVLGAFFGRAWEALALAGFTRLVIINQATYLINSAAHSVGTKKYDPQSTAGDSHWIAFLTAGEGYHNYHHRYPFDYRNGHKFFHWDPTKWFIFSLSKLGLVSDLKQRMAFVDRRTKT